MFADGFNSGGRRLRAGWRFIRFRRVDVREGGFVAVVMLAVFFDWMHEPDSRNRLMEFRIELVSATIALSLSFNAVCIESIQPRLDPDVIPSNR